MATPVADSTATCDWYDLPCVAQVGFDWTYNAVASVPKIIFGAVLDALSSIISAIPALPFVDQLKSNAAALGTLQGFGYLADMFALGPGIGIVFTSLLARFLLRRIPLIG